MVMLAAAEVRSEGEDIVRVRFLEGVGVELEHAEEIIEAVLRGAAIGSPHSRPSALSAPPA